MAIPLALVTLTIQRVTPVAGDDGIYDAYDSGQPAPVTIASGIRAVIGQPSASVVLTGGDRVVYSATFDCDPADVQPADTIIDSTGTVWVVEWARLVSGLGLSHVNGSLRLVLGAM